MPGEGIGEKLFRDALGDNFVCRVEKGWKTKARVNAGKSPRSSLHQFKLKLQKLGLGWYQ